METYAEDKGMQQQWNSSENMGVDKTKTPKRTVDAFRNEWMNEWILKKKKKKNTLGQLKDF